MSSRAKRRVGVLLVLVVGLAAAAFAANTVRKQMQRSAALEARERGMELYAAAESDPDLYDLAMAELSQYVTIFRNDAEALYALADCRHRIPIGEGSRHITSALGYAETARTLDPENTDINELVMALNLRLGRLTETLEAANRVLALDPTNDLALGIRVGAFDQQGRTEEALEAAEAFATAYPDDAFVYGLLLEKRREAGAAPTELAAQAQAAADANPDSIGFALLPIRWNELAGDRAGARQAAAALSERTITDPADLRQLLTYLDGLTMAEEAATVLRNALAADPTNADLAEVSAMRRWQAALPREAAQIFASFPGDPAEASDNTVGRAAFLSVLFDTEGLDRFRTELATRDSAQAQAWKTIVDIQERGVTVEDRNALEDAAATLQNTALPSVMLGQLEASLDEWGLAVTRYEEALRQQPRWLGARLELAELYMAQGRPELARDAATVAYELYPFSAPAIRALNETTTAVAESRTLSISDAETLIRRLEWEAENIPPARAAALGNLVRAHLAEGRTGEAQVALDRLLRTDMKMGARPLGITTVVAMRAGLTGAERLQTTAFDRNTQSESMTAAIELLDQGRPDEGRALLEAEIESLEGENLLRGRLELAFFLDRAGNPEAGDLYAEIAEANPGNVDAQTLALQSQSLWNDEEAVEAAIGRLRALSGEQGSRWRIFEARRRIYLEGSERAIASAVDLLAPLLSGDAANVDATLLYADAVTALGDPATGLEALRRAISLAPARSELRGPLIAQLRRLGRANDARQELSAYMDYVSIPAAQRRQRIELALSLGMTAEAQRDAAALANSDNALDIAARASVADAQGDRETADRLYELAARSPGADRPTKLFAARRAYLEGRTDEAMSHVESIGDDELTRARAMGDFVRGSLLEPEAAAAAKRLDDASDEPADLAVAAQLAILAGDGAYASNLAQRAGETADAEAKAAALADRSVDTRQMLTQVLRGPEPWREEAVDLLYGSMISNRDLRSAADRFIEGAGGSASAWLVVAEVKRAAGDLPGAAAALARGSDRVPDNVDLPRLASLALLDAGQPERAASYAQTWRDRAAQDPVAAIVTQAVALSRAGAWDEASSLTSPHAERILSSGPEIGAAMVAHGWAQRGEVGRAFELLAERAPTSPFLAKWLADLPDRVPDASDRRRLIEQIEPVVAGDTLASMITVTAWQRLSAETGNDENAERGLALAQRIANATNEPSAWFLTALSLENLGRADEAEAAYRSTLAGAPTDIRALNNLAFMLVRQNRSISEAVTLAERALQTAEAAGYDDATLATILHTLGSAQLPEDAEAALGSLDRAVSLAAQGSSVRIDAALGACEALIALGRTQDAAGRFRQLGLQDNELGNLGETAKSRVERIRAALR